MAGNWPKRIVHWTIGDTAYLSVVFTWLLPAAYSLAVWYRQQGYNVKAGGSAVRLMPDYLAGVADTSDRYAPAALPRHNPDATFTSRGCNRRCGFCAVPITEGDLKELRVFTPNPIVCDNNLLACSRAHFDRVIDSLVPLRDIDFNQGLDARLLTAHHIDRLKSLDIAVIRFAFDDLLIEPRLFKAVEAVLNAGFPRSKIRCYVLANYEDTPDDAMYRCNWLKDAGILPFVQRYQPRDTLVLDSYVSVNWTAPLLAKFVRYWNRQRYFSKVPFDEFDNSIRRPRGKEHDREPIPLRL